MNDEIEEIQKVEKVNTEKEYILLSDHTHKGVLFAKGLKLSDCPVPVEQHSIDSMLKFKVLKEV